MQNFECHHDLDWTAFCYAAGELSAAEALSFEERLAEDQNAREALARAVELTQAVSLAEGAAAETPEPVIVARTERSLWGRRLAWMAVGSAASLLVAALISGPLAPRADIPLAEPDSHTGDLAVAWSQTRQELSAASDAGLWFSDHLDAVGGDAVAGDAADPLGDNREDREDSALAAAPSWLTAAVRSSAGLPVDPDSTPFDGESLEN